MSSFISVSDMLKNYKIITVQDISSFNFKNIEDKIIAIEMLEYFQLAINYTKANISIFLNFDALSNKDFFKYLAIFKILKQRLDTYCSKESELYKEVNYKTPIIFDSNQSELVDKIKLIHDMIFDLNDNYHQYYIYSGDKDIITTQNILANNEDLKDLDMYSLTNNVFVTKYNTEYTANLLLIMKLLYNAISSGRIEVIWNPRPEILFRTQTSDPDKNYDLINNANRRNEELKTLYQIFCNIDKYEYDSEIFQISPISYIIIKFSIINFKQFTLENWKIDEINGDDDINDNTIQNNIKNLRKSKNKLTTTTDIPNTSNTPKINSGVKFFKVKYEDGEKRNITSNPDLNRLFHGSTNQNWFSIFFNGLKTGTAQNKLFLNGAAYGTGIYLANTITYSISYAGSTHYSDPNTNVINNDHKDKSSRTINTLINSRIVGVFALEEDKKKYHRGSCIYVVPPSDETKVILEYLILFPPTSGNNVLTKIDNYFINNLGKKIIQQKTVEMKVGNKRILGELKRLQKQNDILDTDSGLHYVMHLDESNFYRIQFDLPINNFTKDDILRRDMEAYGYDKIQTEFILPPNYPFEPPFVRLLNPRFQFMTGHITSGGSICMELLTNQGWTQTTTMQKILLIIKMNMLDGGARIDPINHNKPYGMSEAKSAYDRMLKSHGWK
jgi:ubiquitin-protein ligase